MILIRIPKRTVVANLMIKIFVDIYHRVHFKNIDSKVSR